MDATMERTEGHGQPSLLAFEETAMEWAMELSMGGARAATPRGSYSPNK